MRFAVVAALAVAAFGQPDTSEYARTRFEVIVPLLRQNRLEEAEQLTRELLRRAEGNLSPESLEVARILTLLGDVLQRRGRGGDSETVAFLERAYRLKATARGLQDEETQYTGLRYVDTLTSAGRFEEAMALTDRIAADLAAPTSPEGSFLAKNLGDLAARLYLLGRPERAKPLAERAVAASERINGPTSAETAQALAVLAFVQQAFGEVASAVASMERVVSINEAALGPTHRLTIASHNNLALQYLGVGRHADALRLFDRANEAREKLLGPDHPHNAIGLHNKARLMLLTASYAQAQDLLEKALALRQRTIGPSHRLTGLTLSTLALAEFYQNAFDAALQHSTQALSVLRGAVGERHPEYVNALDVHALILGRTKGAALAFNNALLAARLRNENARVSAQGMAERSALHLSTEVNEVHGGDLIMGLLMQQDDPLDSAAVREAWDYRIGSRALVLDEMSARRRLVAEPSDPSVHDLRNALSAVRRKLSNLVLTGGDEGVAAPPISEVLKEKDRLEGELGLRSATFRRDLQRSRIGFAEVSARLPRASALVSFVQFLRLPAKEPWLAAFVLTAGSENPTLIPIGQASEVERAVKGWRATLSVAASDPTRAGKRLEAQTRAIGDTLRKIVWDPLQPHLRSADLLFIVPDGALHLLSFPALPVGSNQYLVETGPTIHMLAAERDLVPVGGPSGKNASLLAMANPAYDGQAPRRETGPTTRPSLRSASPACGDLRKVRFSALPASRLEVTEIARLWRGASKPTILSGAAANEAEFRAKAPGQQVVHLATHGFLLGEHCGADGLIGEAAAQSPLVLSGLALAGANRRERPDGEAEDGLLTAEEIAGMNLEGVEWVVLSGCDTGRGQIRASEGVLGLRRAFQTAGAATVIVSLWEVEDHAAREWMRSLYANRFQRKKSTAESLREASLSVLKARRASGASTHPFFWAAFSGAGDWR